MGLELLGIAAYLGMGIAVKKTLDGKPNYVTGKQYKEKFISSLDSLEPESWHKKEDKK